MSENQDLCVEVSKDQLLEAFLGKDVENLFTELVDDSETEDDIKLREDRGLELFSQAMDSNPRIFEDTAFEVLGSLLMGGVSVVDKVAELMMDKNPAGYVNAIFKAADRCTVPYVKFALVRAIFRRYPGRYRPYILALGRVLITGKSEFYKAGVASWMLRKFGSELVPDLVSFMKGDISVEERIEVLKESVQMLGSVARPVVAAAMETDSDELRSAGTESLKRIE